MARPTDPAVTPTDLTFAEAASGVSQIEQPDLSHRTGNGWVASEKPRFKWFNYLFKWYHAFIQYFYDCFDDVYETIGIFTTNFININNTFKSVGEHTGIVTYGTQEISINGFSTPLSTNLHYKKTVPYTGVATKTVVKLYIDGISDTDSNNATSMSCTSGTLPTEIRPASGARYIPLSCLIDNSYSGVSGVIKLDSDGTITFMMNIVDSTKIKGAGTGFSATGTKGFSPICVEYFM